MSKTHYQVVIFRGEGWFVYHQYRSAPPNSDYGAWANYHMLKDQYPVVLVANGWWIYGNDAARTELDAGNYPPQITAGFGSREVMERRRNGRPTRA